MSCQCGMRRCAFCEVPVALCSYMLHGRTVYCGVTCSMMDDIRTGRIQVADDDPIEVELISKKEIVK